MQFSTSEHSFGTGEGTERGLDGERGDCERRVGFNSTFIPNAILINL